MVTTMTEDTRLTDRQIDAKLAEFLFGLKLVGWYPTRAYECADDEVVCPDDEGDPEPAYLAREPEPYRPLEREYWSGDDASYEAAEAEDRAAHESDFARFGCNRYDMGVVSRYSSTGDGMLAVMQEMARREFATEINHEGANAMWEAEFYIMRGHSVDDFGAASHPSAPRAVSLAALRALGVTLENEGSNHG